MKIDREFLYKLEISETRTGIENVIDDCDDDDIAIILREQYNQILEFNKEESIENIKKIIIYKYRNYCQEN